jgi:poly(3-hydroxybutyrate) depolymerase
MRKYLPLLCGLLLKMNLLVAQNCEECRYLSPVFDSVSVTTVHFGEGTTADGDLQQLYMDVYEPVGDTESKRPVVIFAFGGGFVQGSRTDWYVREVCEHFAKAGYVAVANDYRLGINPWEILQLQHMRIFFRPMQDMRATVQYLKADFAELGDNFRIDTARIIIGGASAGGITALMTSHCDTPEKMAEMGSLNALNALGGFYSTSGFYPDYSWNGLATVNVSGALVNAEWVEPGHIPIISAHGDADNVVPYGYGPFGGGLLGGVFDLQGSAIVHEKAEEVGLCSYLFTMEGHDHPNTGMGMPYLRSVVQRIMERCYAVINGRTFCCDLGVSVASGDTLFLTDAGGEFPLEAELHNDNGSAELLWCGVPCGLHGSGPTVVAAPDTTWEFISLIAHEDGCQAQDIHIVKYGEASTSSAPLTPDSGFRVFPNPAGDLVTVHFNARSAGHPVLEMFTTDGRKVTRAISVTPIQGGMTVDVSELSPGVYLLRAVDGHGALLGHSRITISR